MGGRLAELSGAPGGRTVRKSKRSVVRRRLRDGLALLFLKGCNHLPHTVMFATRCEDFQALFLRAPLQNVDVNVPDAPLPHLAPAWLVQVNGVRADQGISIIVDHIFFTCLGNPEPGSKRKVRPIRRGAHHMATGKVLAQCVVDSASSLVPRVGSGTHMWYATPAGESRFRLRGAADGQAGCNSCERKVKASTLHYRVLNNSPCS
jgi:hypothetical protein